MRGDLCLREVASVHSRVLSTRRSSTPAFALAQQDRQERHVGKALAKTSTATKPSGSGRSAEQLKAMRERAGKNGFDVSPRGRVRADVIDAFDAAH
ncbi:histone-like nucleoid-structuring protein Lsr2 [Rhodococcus sp. ARP2]|uniref:Lsr2 family DNA-binding protein n=1 Tax=Rhodococcus sp. ARP2 TaxID=1661385 RepID=UPI0009E476DC|nr:histone-like nucleoid-structuring protein Lsr2 [Rhodococcus sp. ARP2]